VRTKTNCQLRRLLKQHGENGGRCRGKGSVIVFASAGGGISPRREGAAVARARVGSDGRNSALEAATGTARRKRRGR
jgi:hypothetical protein